MSFKLADIVQKLIINIQLLLPTRPRKRVFTVQVRSGFINRTQSTSVPLHSPVLKMTWQKATGKLNQSHAASCVTARCHGYLTAVATGVNAPCRTTMDEARREERENKSIRKFADTHWPGSIEKTGASNISCVWARATSGIYCHCLNKSGLDRFQ